MPLLQETWILDVCVGACGLCRVWPGARAPGRPGARAPGRPGARAPDRPGHVIGRQRIRKRPSGIKEAYNSICETEVL